MTLIASLYISHTLVYCYKKTHITSQPSYSRSHARTAFFVCYIAGRQLGHIQKLSTYHVRGHYGDVILLRVSSTTPDKVLMFRSTITRRQSQGVSNYMQMKIAKVMTLCSMSQQVLYLYRQNNAQGLLKFCKILDVSLYTDFKHTKISTTRLQNTKYMTQNSPYKSSLSQYCLVTKTNRG